jgi:hypothetical protein
MDLPVGNLLPEIDAGGRVGLRVAEIAELENGIEVPLYLNGIGEGLQTRDRVGCKPMVEIGNDGEPEGFGRRKFERDPASGNESARGRKEVSSRHGFIIVPSANTQYLV